MRSPGPHIPWLQLRNFGLEDFEMEFDSQYSGMGGDEDDIADFFRKNANCRVSLLLGLKIVLI